MKFLATVVLAIFLVGCSLIEPSAESRFTAERGTSVEIVFTCVESTIRSLTAHERHWSDTVTTRNTATGLLETGTFSEVNLIGVRAQVKYNPDTGNGRIKVKASGPYFIDLGADLAAVQLADGITKCL